MKVFLFSIGFIDYIIELANALSKKEKTILMLPKSSLTETRISSISNDITLEPFSMPRQRNPACLMMINKIVKTIGNHQPDVLHIQSHGHPWLFLGFPFLKKYPIVNTVHDPKPHPGEEKWRYRFATRFGLKYSNHIIVHGKKLKRDMLFYYHLHPDEVHVIPHGNFILFTKYIAKIYPEEENTILFFGRLWKYKGLEFLMKAEPLITEQIPDLKIIVAVHGEPFSKYENHIVNKERFEIIERYIPNEEVAELFQKSSLVVLPYIEASQSGVLNIAYAFKKPVVVTEIGALPEIVDDGKTGYIVASKDEKALADAIIKILKNNQMRKDMGINGFKKAKREFSWDRIAEMTISIYEKAVNGKLNQNDNS